MSRQASFDNWTELINDFQSSGQSMAVWYRNNNLKVHQLTYRLKISARSILPSGKTVLGHPWFRNAKNGAL